MPFDTQPTLRGSLVELRPLRSEDYANLFVVAADPGIWEQHADKTRHTEAGFAAFFRESLASGGALVVVETASQRIIGATRFHGFREETREVEIGWTFLARSHWGGRYNREVKHLMLRHAFETVDAVVFFVERDNVRSQRAVSRIGGVLEPRLDSRGRLTYRITASAFAGGGR